MGKCLFVTGTGTDVGKTYVTGLILKKLQKAGKNAAYYKAAMSGNERGPDGRLIPGDAVQVKQISGIGQSLDEMCPYVYEAAVSPHLASALEGNPVRMDVVRRGLQAMRAAYPYLTVEGSGGILCPIAFGEEIIWMEDVIRETAADCLVVAEAGLGTINAVLLTVHYMKSRGIHPAGIILNRFHPGDRLEEDNRQMCALSGVPVLACLEEGCQDLPLDTETLLSLYQ